MKSLSTGTRLYIALVVVASLAAVWWAAAQWRPEPWLQFGFYVILGLAASALKVNLPGIAGTMSVSYVFVLVSIVELNELETLVVAACSVLAQSLWKPRIRPRPVQLLFNVASAVCCAAAGDAVFHARWLRALDGSVPVQLFFASCAYYLWNTVSVAGVIALSEGKRCRQVWRENFLWTAPQYLFGAALAALIHASNRYVGWQYSLLVLPAVYLVHYSYRMYLERLEEEKKHVSEMADLHLRTVEALALAIEAKDEGTHNHLRRVQVYGIEIAKELGLSEKELQALEAAALLHDIGKLAVPEYIISKPGRLTPEEFEKIKIHPVVGAEILECVNFPSPVVPIVRAHHEKWNGTGYPDGLKGEEIPVGARILAAVDCMDALATERPYRRALPVGEAMEIIREESGKSFDPRVVEILGRRYHELEELARRNSVRFTRLSKGARVFRGEAPDSGLDTTGTAPRTESGERSLDFINSIAAARQEVQMLHEVTRDLGNSLSLHETLSLLASRLRHMVPHHAIAIYVLKENKLLPQYVDGDDRRLFTSLEIPLGQGLSGWVVENKKPVLNGSPSVEAGYLNDPAKFSTLRSALSVPLEGLSGVVGALTLYHAGAEAFTRDHLRILLAISSKAGLTIENALEYGQARQSAVTDQLTGLPNTRSLFLQLDAELGRCKRSGTRLAILVLDLDRFKQVNDRFGHLKGNQILESTGRILRESCREYDYVARMGGDEFVMVLPGATESAATSRCAHVFERIVEMGRLTLNEDLLSVSIGVAFSPDDGADAEQLLAAADKRMYQMKQLHHARAGQPVQNSAPADFPVQVVQ
jgi:diguanylate cyclase (GGDEF)-like protein/putative nucleotidyltransferase with HDIG domain